MLSACDEVEREGITKHALMQRNYTGIEIFFAASKRFSFFFTVNGANKIFSDSELEMGLVFRATIKPVRKTFFCRSPQFRTLALRCTTPLRDASDEGKRRDFWQYRTCHALPVIGGTDFCLLALTFSIVQPPLTLRNCWVKTGNR
jgi:hypothetical protein